MGGEQHHRLDGEIKLAKCSNKKRSLLRVGWNSELSLLSAIELVFDTVLVTTYNGAGSHCFNKLN